MPDTIHLLIPLAASHAPGCQAALASLALPHLNRLLARLTATGTDAGEEADFAPPHERALARHLGLPDARSGSTPWAAWTVEQALPAGAPHGQAWAWVTPCHWQVGTDHITMDDPGRLQLREAESRALLELLAPWFAEDGIALHYHAPTLWLAQGAVFDGLATASLDRAIGCDVRAWLPDAARAGLLHRLHSEMQMLLYTHPFNDARAAQGLPPVNAFWVHGAGALAAPPAPAAAVQMPMQLRDAALREDWAAWAEAWRALDAGPVAQLAAKAAAGARVRLTLCGERSARQWEGSGRGLAARIRSVFVSKPWPTLGSQL
ncbi:phosphoglycerate mutase [Melaminivora sp.]|uniref:phosphoglycerate mutase n=1 Tax=Melaminivora sp. TaxID=1933032 RepID=UPI0028AC64BC|nr:phosphoglycerate mutase [Melaminivora sp.]